MIELKLQSKHTLKEAHTWAGGLISAHFGGFGLIKGSLPSFLPLGLWAEQWEVAGFEFVPADDLYQLK